MIWGGLWRGIGVAIVLIGMAVAHADDKTDQLHQNQALRGKALVDAYECGQCHSQDGGIVKPAVPNLAGQKYQYLYRQLIHFEQERQEFGGEVVYQRKHPVMTRFGDKLTHRQMADMARFYSYQACITPENPKGLHKQTTPRAKAIRAQAQWCEICHGGERYNPFTDTPWLSGQSADYLEETVTRLQDAIARPGHVHGRSHRMAEVMFPDFIAIDAKGLADYYEGLGCLIRAQSE